MDNRERRCGLCGQVNQPAAEFCAECGVLLASVAMAGLQRARQTQFALPDYLLAAREREREERRRRLAETGEGVGILWIGAIAALLALWFGGASGIGAPVFSFGIVAILFGLWRLRDDERTLARVGTATVIVASTMLGAALAQTLGFAGTPLPAPRAAISAPTPTPDPAEAIGVESLHLGVVPAFRGNAARSGEQPGPAPLERPVVRWKSFVGGETYSSPVVGNDVVYVATKAGSLVALGVGDGQELWRANVGDYVARSTPAYDGHSLYVSSGYALIAIDAATGRQRWSVPLRFAGWSSPAVSGDFVFAATQEGHVSAFVAESGEEAWHYRNDQLLFSSPAVAGEVVVIADETGYVTGIDARTGRELWQSFAGGEVFATPAIGDGLVIVATTKPSLVAFELGSGKERWRREAGGESSPAITDGRVFLGGSDQALRVFDQESGEPGWSSPLGYKIRSSATVSDGAVFIGSGPALNAISQSDGRPLWTYVTGGDVTSDMAVVGGMVIATSHDGYVYALGPPVAKGEGQERDLSVRE
jgi:outer membrane protein assembly factor BamB